MLMEVILINKGYPKDLKSVCGIRLFLARLI